MDAASLAGAAGAGAESICTHAWVIGEEVSNGDFVSPTLYVGFSIAGVVFAVAQIAILTFARGMNTLAHKIVQAVAFADLLGCVWWIVFAPHERHDSVYKHDASCQLVEWLRVSLHVSAMFWVFMQCLLVAFNSYNFYSFGVVSRHLIGLYIFFIMAVPTGLTILIAAWRFSSPCPSSLRENTDLAGFSHNTLNVTSIAWFVLSLIFVVGVLIKYSAKRGGASWWRLAATIVSLGVRAVPGAMGFVEWSGGSCNSVWSQFVSVAFPLLPVLHFFAFFVRRDIYSRVQASACEGTASKHGTPHTSFSQYSHHTGLTSTPGSSVAPSHTHRDIAVDAIHATISTQDDDMDTSAHDDDDASPLMHRPPSSSDVHDRRSILDMPLKVQQAHLDFLWGISTQAIMVEKKSRRIVFAAADSDTYVTSKGKEKKKRDQCALHNTTTQHTCTHTGIRTMNLCTTTSPVPAYKNAGGFFFK